MTIYVKKVDGKTGTISGFDKTGEPYYIIRPTIFPDGTSQIWHLPDWLKSPKCVKLVWLFTAEREIFDIMSLRLLWGWKTDISLHIPYLPFARQDKFTSNDETFSLHTFGWLLNQVGCKKITAVDAHNPNMASERIFQFHNIPVTNIHKELIEQIKPNFLVFPDSSAAAKYGPPLSWRGPYFTGYKERHASDGSIKCHTLSLAQHGWTTMQSGWESALRPGDKFLILDDICDGGMTFVSVAKAIREKCPTAHITMFVTHGLFSNSRDFLHKYGIDAVITTNSLLRNAKESINVVW